MFDLVENLQIAAGIDFDSIAPFVFIFLIVISQVFGAFKKKNARKEEEPDVDALERARQIREEIRRRIEERRQEVESGQPRPVSRPREPEYDPTMPDNRQRPGPAPQMQRRTVSPEPTSERRTSPAQPAYTPPARKQPSLEQQLAEQRIKLEHAQQKQKEAHARARRMLQESGAEKRVRENQSWEIAVDTNKVKRQLVSSLRSRNGLRQAVLYKEIIGKPLGLR